MNKELTVIIPIYNDREHINRCLKSIEDAKNNQIANVLLIDDGSDYTYDDIIKKYELDISIHRGLII